MRKLLRFVGERHTLPVGAILLASFPALLCSQQAEQGAPAGRGGRGPAATYWAAKTKGGVYVPPNKPLVKLADLKAKHAGETNWTEIVVKDPENQAEYNSAAPGAKFQPRLHPDTGALFVVVAGDIHFEIENLQPIEATRGSIVNILRTTIYSFEIKGDKPALWVEIKPLNYQTVFPGDGPPPTPPGTEMVKVSFGRTKAVYSPPNIPHWNLFEAAKSGAPNTYRALQDHLFANPIYGYADPNDPANPNRGNPGAGGRGGRGGRGGADSGPFNPNSVFGHMHPGPAEWWIVQSGQVVGRFENTGEFVGSEGDILYATPMTWHQMGFQGPGLSCRLALGAYDFINMNNTADQAQANPALAQTVRPFVEKYCLKCHGGTAATPGAPVPLLPMLSARDTFLLRRREWETLSYVLQSGQMPPTSEPRPAATEVAAVLEVIQKEFAATGAKPAVPERAATRDWVTFGYDPERSGWARAETALTKANAGRLSLLWKSQLDAVPNNVNTYSTLTQPLVVENVSTRQGPRTMVFVASAENNIYALDNTTGAIIWKKAFPNNATPPAPATGNCPNNLNATPVIDKGNSIIYVLPNDGKLRGLSLADGEMKVPPTVLVPAFSRNFSLNLADGFLFTSTTRGCGNAISEIVAMNLNSPDRPVFHFYPSPGKGAGPWGKGGIVKSPSGVLAQTADGAYDPASGRFGNTILNLTNDMRLLDSYTPANEAVLNAKDYDLGSNSPIVFSFERWTLASTAAKEGVIYLLDAMDLGGADHRTPLFVSQRYGNDAGVFGYHGVWNALATWVDGQGKRWLFVPMYGPTAKDTVSSFPKSYGPVVNGSLMAFTVQVKNGKPILVPEWNSGDLDLPGTPVVANGVVYVMASGDRATDAIRGPRGGRGGPGGPGGPGGRGGGRGVTLSEVNPNQPGYEHDAAWRALQLRPVEEGGQQSGARNSGGRDTTHGVLYALDAATGAELFTSGEAIDSWNHDGNIALSGGTLYLSTYHGRVYAFGLRK